MCLHVELFRLSGRRGTELAEHRLGLAIDDPDHVHVRDPEGRALAHPREQGATADQRVDGLFSGLGGSLLGLRGIVALGALIRLFRLTGILSSVTFAGWRLSASKPALDALPGGERALRGLVGRLALGVGWWGGAPTDAELRPFDGDRRQLPAILLEPAFDRHAIGERLVARRLTQPAFFPHELELIGGDGSAQRRRRERAIFVFDRDGDAVHPHPPTGPARGLFRVLRRIPPIDQAPVEGDRAADDGDLFDRVRATEGQADRSRVELHPRDVRVDASPLRAHRLEVHSGEAGPDVTDRDAPSTRSPAILHLTRDLPGKPREPQRGQGRRHPQGTGDEEMTFGESQSSSPVQGPRLCP